MYIYSIYDETQKKWLTPFFQPNDDTAKRTYLQQICIVPFWEDLKLHKVGYFNEDVEGADAVLGGCNPVPVPITQDEIDEYRTKFYKVQVRN